MMINKWTTERVLTDLRYIQKTGWIKRDTEEIRISKIEEVDLKQSILGRILGYGSINISGTGSGKITLELIDDPLIFQKNLNNLKSNSSRNLQSSQNEKVLSHYSRFFNKVEKFFWCPWSDSNLSSTDFELIALICNLLI